MKTAILSRLAACACVALMLSACAPAPRQADRSWASPPSSVTDPETGIAYLKEKVFIRSGADDIASVLLTPMGKGPFNAVVHINGSGAGLASPEEPLMRKLVTGGTAVLLLGKKGVGASGGRWESETFADRAANVQAALDWMAARPEVDPARIGMLGHSQGAYIAPLVAANGKGAAYAVLLAPSSQQVRDQIATDYVYRRMRDESLAPAQARAAGERYMLLLDAAMAACPLVRVHYLCGDYRYDPQPALERVRIPVLALFGERDTLVPPDENVERLRAGLKKSGAPHTIKVFAQANHQFWKSVRGTASEQAELGKPGPVSFAHAEPGNALHEHARMLRANRVEYADGYFDTVLDFVRANGAL